MIRFDTLGLAAVMVGVLGGCGADYSPNTYSSTAVQQANKVEQGVVVGFREVAISANGTVGAVTGGAAGGLIGSQAPGGGLSTAFGALGGTVIGGLVGTTAEHATGDTTGFEYIVQKSAGDLISVTQKDKLPLALGQHVLVIAGNQARIVPDYTSPDLVKPPASGPTTTAPAPPPIIAQPLPPPPGAVPPPAPAAPSAQASP